MRLVLLFLFFFPRCQAFAGDSPQDFKAQPNLEWKFLTKGPIVASPVIDGNTVYVGSSDSVLYALNVGTGTLRWDFRIGGPIKAAVCVDADRVFLVGGDGTVRCFSGKSGQAQWTFKTNGEKLYELYSYADYYNSSPTVYNNVLYFGSGDGSVYALKTSTGELLWTYKTGDVVHGAPVLYHDTLVVGSFDGYAYALHAADGKLIWKFKSVGHRYFPKGEMQGSPAVGNGLVYIGSRDYNVYAIDIEKGYCHWNRQFPLGWAMALSCRDSILYIGTSDDDLMVAVDGRTGKELWNTNVKFNTFGACSFSESMLYLGTLMGKVYGMDRQTGAIRWTFSTDGYKAHHATYFKSEDRIVKDDFYRIVQTPEGYIRALHELGGIFSKPALSQSRIIVTSTDGAVYCLGR